MAKMASHRPDEQSSTHERIQNVSKISMKEILRARAVEALIDPLLTSNIESFSALQSPSKDR